MRRVRVGTDIQLPRQRVAFEHDGVADALGSLAVGQFAMQADSLLLGKILLLELELGCEIEQAELLLFFGNDLVEKGQMISEENDGRRIVDLRIFADVTLEENRRHGRDVLVAEAQIGTSETGIAGLD